MGDLYFAGEDFDYRQANIFSSDGNYGSNWIVFKLVDENEHRIVSGELGKDLYVVIVSKAISSWKFRLMDFIFYHSGDEEKKVIISARKEDYEEAKEQYRGHSNTDNVLREYEPNILVHSTTKELWEKIHACGSLKSWNLAKGDGLLHEKHPIGKNLKDPQDFSNYVMVGELGVHSEIIVLSKQLGELCYDENMEYEPGGRIYLHAEKIAKDGILVRDGVHIKIRDELLLEPYMMEVVTKETLINTYGMWTPKTFSEQADKYILGKFLSD